MMYFLFGFDDSLEVNRECRLISTLREKQEEKSELFSRTTETIYSSFKRAFRRQRRIDDRFFENMIIFWRKGLKYNAKHVLHKNKISNFKIFMAILYTLCMSIERDIVH
jgi:hypothetical protein